MKQSSGKTALVLSGGGSRGAYQVGAWKALTELGIEFDMVVGVSAGALNGAMVVQGNLVLAENLWRQVEADNIFEVEAGAQPVDYAMEFAKTGGISSAPLQRLVKKYAPEEAIRKSPVDLGVLAVELPSFKPHYLWKSEISEGKIADYIVASASPFPGIKPKRIDGRDYVYGGVVNNMPIHMAVEHGATKVIAIYLKAIGVFDAKKELSSCDDITLIEPNYDLGSFLVFDNNNSARIMRLGYIDTMKAFDVYDGGKYYAFAKGAFHKKLIPMVDAAAHIFDLDPLILYRRESYMEAMTEAVEATKKDISTFRTKRLTIEKALEMIKGSGRESAVLLMAKDIKQHGDSSIFMNSYARKVLKEDVYAAILISRFFNI